MGLPLLQQEVGSRFRKCHFEIRGWKTSTASDRAKATFNKFIAESNTSRTSSSLKIESIYFEDSVAYVSHSRLVGTPSQHHPV